MKVLLLNLPDYSHSGKGYSLPLGLAYIAAVLEQKGIEVHAIDLASNKKKAMANYLTYEKKTLKKIKKINPDIIGISCTTFNRYNVFYYSKILKKELSNVRIVVGGPHVSFTVHDTLKNVPTIDFISIGEGENTFVQLCNALKKKRPLSTVKGLAYRKNSKIIINPTQELIKNLDSLPFPARHMFPIDEYDVNRPGIPAHSAMIMATRGCPGACKFCSASYFWQKKYRIRSVDNVIDEIEEIITKYPKTKGLYFFDDSLTISKKYIIHLCNEMKSRKIDIPWVTSSRINVDREVLSKMKDSGCTCIDFGVESGSQKMLDAMSKNISIEQIKKVMQITHDLKLKARSTWIIGLPHETYNDALETVNLINYLKKYIHARDFIINYGTMLLPGTPWTTEYFQNHPDTSWVNMNNELKNISMYDAHNNPLVPRIKLNASDEARINRKLKMILYPRLMLHFILNPKEFANTPTMLKIK